MHGREIHLFFLLFDVHLPAFLVAAAMIMIRHKKMSEALKETEHGRVFVCV